MMHLFLAGLLLLTLSFIVHIVMWRLYLPRRQILALLCIFAATPCLAVMICVVTKSLPILTAVPAPDAFRIFLFYVSCSLVYLCIYSAIELESPSLAIVLYVANCGSVGCSEAELVDLLADDDSLNARIDSMEAGKLLVIRGGNCRLTPQGRLWANLFESASKIFRLPLGG